MCNTGVNATAALWHSLSAEFLVNDREQFLRGVDLPWLRASQDARDLAHHHKVARMPGLSKAPSGAPGQPQTGSCSCISIPQPRGGSQSSGRGHAGTTARPRDSRRCSHCGDAKGRWGAAPLATTRWSVLMETCFEPPSAQRHQSATRAQPGTACGAGAFLRAGIRGPCPAVASLLARMRALAMAACLWVCAANPRVLVDWRKPTRSNMSTVNVRPRGLAVPRLAGQSAGNPA